MTTANKTQITEASVDDFITMAKPIPSQEEASALVALFQTLTGVDAKMWGPSIIGFGSYIYQYESGREGIAPIVGFSPRIAQLVFYGLDVAAITAQTATQLGKHSLGKGCLYAKKLSDLNLSVLSELVTQAWERHKNDAPI
jgi:hypothetical protein